MEAPLASPARRGQHLRVHNKDTSAALRTDTCALLWRSTRRRSGLGAQARTFRDIKAHQLMFMFRGAAWRLDLRARSFANLPGEFESVRSALSNCIARHPTHQLVQRTYTTQELSLSMRRQMETVRVTVTREDGSNTLTHCEPHGSIPIATRQAEAGNMGNEV